MNDASLARKLQSATPKTRILLATQSNVLGEIADADGFVGNITPDEVHAAKKLNWVQVMSAEWKMLCSSLAATICAIAT